MSMVWLPLGWHTRRLRRIRADWAKPLQHSRNLKAMAETHASRLAAIRDQRSLDDRTWADLNLDEVFVALDRTSSTLGQHALYHRMRSGPPGEGLEEFEALVERLRADPAMRERAQLALERLQEPHGYDVWWLGQPDAVEAPRWYGIFPLLTAGALVSIALAPVWPGMLLAMLAINLFVRYRVDRRINALSVSIRHCAPLLRAARTLGDLTRNSDLTLVRALDEASDLARLKRISTWTSGNPLLLALDAPRVWLFLGDFIGVVYEYLNLLLLLDATGLYFAVRDLKSHGASLLRVTAAVGEIDTAISVASYRDGSGDWTRPRFEPDGALSAIDLRHPLVRDAVPNSIVLRPGGVCSSPVRTTGAS